MFAVAQSLAFVAVSVVPTCPDNVCHAPIAEIGTFAASVWCTPDPAERGRMILAYLDEQPRAKLRAEAIDDLIYWILGDCATWDVRSAIPGDAVEAVATAVLDDADHRVRLRAGLIANSFHLPDALMRRIDAELESLLRHDNLWMRAEALRILDGEWGDFHCPAAPSATARGLEAIVDTRREILGALDLDALAQAAGRAEPEPVLDAYERRERDVAVAVVLGEVRQLERAGDRQSAAMMATHLAHPDAFVRSQALGALTRLHAIEQLSEIAGLLVDPDPQVRGLAVIAVASIGGQDASPLVRLRLGDADSGVRLTTLKSVAELGVHDDIEAVAGLLRDPATRRLAAEVIEAWPASVHATLPPLLDLLQDEDPDVHRCVTELSRRLRASDPIGCHEAMLDYIRGPRR